MLGLWSSGIKKGDEVITSPISFIATSNSISHIGAVPVFVDVDEDLNINPDLIEKATGTPPSSEPFLNYINEKYSKIYNF